MIILYNILIKTYPMKVWTSLLIYIFIQVITSHTFRCLFDHHNVDLHEQAEKNVPQQPEITPGSIVNGRLLQTTDQSAYRNMRILLDTTPFSNTVITPGVNGAATTTRTSLDFIVKTLNVAKTFYEKRLKASPLLSITVPDTCVDITPYNKGTVINNYELIIYAQYLTNKQIGYGATGKSCDYVTGSYPDYTLQVGRPTVGRMIFNTYNLVDQVSSLTNMLFQSVTTTTIHEMTHILGFDSTMYSKFLDPSTGYKYSYTVQELDSPLVNSNRPKTSILTTPYVKAWARTHFGCNTLTGMLLENQDGTGAGSASHWQRTAIYDEMMTATAFGATKGVFGLTFALLKDTGWYLADDTFLETTNYGYQRGCSFVLDACYNSTSFPEFCNIASSLNVSSCQTTFYGKTICDNDASLMSDSCPIYAPYFSCVDPDSSDPGYQPYTYEAYSTSSFCVYSTLGRLTIPPTMTSRCYPYVCGTSSIVFTIGSYSITCLNSQKGVKKTLSALKGQLTCPDFNQFCTISRKPCKNWCGNNGYCTQGVCNCLPANFGVDCSITTCTSPQYYNPVSQTCVPSCTTGTYPNIFSQTCEQCLSPCAGCIDNPTKCTSCISGSTTLYLYKQVCYTSCPSSTFLSSGSCYDCSSAANCLTCSATATTCTSCKSGYYLDGTTCINPCISPKLTDTANNKCVTVCEDYLFKTATTCQYCPTGQFLQNDVCVGTCVMSGGVNTYPDSTLRACKSCSIFCLNCDGPYAQNCTSCKPSSDNRYLLLKMCWKFCPKGFYANPSTNKCQVCPVQLSCQACIYDATDLVPYCTSCIYNTFFNLSSRQCISSCVSTQYQNKWNNSCSDCHSSCLTCRGPSEKSCLSCDTSMSIVLLSNGTGSYCLANCPTDGYIQFGDVCTLCDSTCKTCSGVESDECLTCQAGYFLSNDHYCRYICPMNYYPDTTTYTCEPCDISCTYCFDGTPGGCTSCPDTKYLYNFTCTGTCPLGLTPNQWGVCHQLYIYLNIALILLLLLGS